VTKRKDPGEPEHEDVTKLRTGGKSGKGTKRKSAAKRKSTAKRKSGAKK
jgi:hypothetical protein